MPTIVRSIVLILAFACCWIPSAQAVSPTLRIEGVTDLAMDKLGFVYVVRGDRLTKYNNQLEPIARYTSSYGDIYSLDVSNPFKAVAFCKDFHRVVLLDNKLAELGFPIFLLDMGIVRPVAVCSSADNAIWVADDYSQQLLYCDLTANTQRAVCSLSNYYSKNNTPPTHILEHGNLVYINFTNHQLIAFDKFGSVVRNIPISISGRFAIFSDLIYYLEDNTLHTKSLTTSLVSPRFSTYKSRLFAITAKHTILYTENLDLIFLD